MATKYVRKTGLDANDGSTIALAKLTIASAITASAPGDTIDIGVGTWAENINSSRVYKGASMYKTIISAATSAWTGLTITLQAIRVNHTTLGANYFSGGALTYIDAIHDLSVGNPTSLLWYAIPALTMTRSIFIGSSTTTSSACFVLGAGNIVAVDHCIFYDIYSAAALVNLSTMGAGTFSMTNSIWHLVNKATAQGISTSSLAWTLEQYNTFYSVLSTFSTLPNSALGTGSKNDVNPLFNDAAGGDFRLSSNSPCIGAGHA